MLFLLISHISQPGQLYFRREKEQREKYAYNDQEWVGFRAEQTLWRPFEGAPVLKLISPGDINTQAKATQVFSSSSSSQIYKFIWWSCCQNSTCAALFCCCHYGNGAEGRLCCIKRTGSLKVANSGADWDCLGV